MTLAVCTRTVLAACSADNAAASASTKATRRRGFWAVTTVKPVGDTTQLGLVRALGMSGRVPAKEALVSPARFGQSVDVWWKE